MSFAITFRSIEFVVDKVNVLLRVCIPASNDTKNPLWLIIELV